MSITRQGSGTGLTMRGPTLEDFDFEILQESTPHIIDPGSTTQVTEDDRIYEETDPGEFLDNRQVFAVGDDHPEPPQYESLDTNIATVDSAGNVTQVANGTVGILVKYPWLTRRLDLTLDNTVSPGKSQIGWTDGSWGKDIADRVDDAIAGKTPAGAKDVYTVANGASGIFTRSTDCWLSGLDVTCASPWNSQSAGRRAGTIITRRHVLFANHYKPKEGETIGFVSSGNEFITREISAIIPHPDYVGGVQAYPDFAVGVLSLDLPSSLTPAVVLPDDWEEYVTLLGRYLPAVFLDQENHANVIDVQYIDDSERDTRRTLLSSPLDATRKEFYELPVTGDSGSPVLLLTSGAPILLTVLTTPTAGTSVVAHKQALNQMIADADAEAGISTGYQLTEYDLSAFTNFSE